MWDFFDHDNDGKLNWMEQAEKTCVLNEIIFKDDDEEEDDDDDDE